MYKQTLNQIKSLLSIEVKLAQVKLDDGITIIEAEQFAPDYSVGIVTTDGIVPLPVGDYTLEDGKLLSVAVEGIIASISDAAPAEPAMPEAPVEINVEAEVKPKRVVESVSKETFFEEIAKLREEFSAIKAENETLKSELAKVELSIEDNEAGASAIKHNPEAEKSAGFRFSGNRPTSTLDKVYSKLFN